MADTKICCSEHKLTILAAILNMQISQIYICSGRAQAQTIWDQYNKNCGLQTPNYAVQSIKRPLWRPSLICRWAKFSNSIFSRTAQAEIYRKIWVQYNKNCGLQTAKYRIQSINWSFWWPSLICKWAKF